MSEVAAIFLYLFGVLQGLAVGYVLWAPETAFKRGFVDGLTLKFLWSKR